MPGKGVFVRLLRWAACNATVSRRTRLDPAMGPTPAGLNRIWKAATGAPQGLFDIYTFTGLGFVIALYSFPYIFIFTTSALEVVAGAP